ncbi:MAG: glycosyltransferase family 2 protein [Candidatus Auribacterota bacterium]|jgi:GT2 family glycosyltransferase|uniref:Glycosyltransferase family 2 protein n=1 Tax=Candidatus Auribacter fodinae TaxID=2093366 RepID=A0A3A4R4U2_9BACT|nr:MAG: glycosyltransferase family 2 protein [Candidatus Auribacter fodinae]
MSKGISVCIVNLNGEELIAAYLPKVIESMDNYKWELIFFDNGSDDNSINIVRELYPPARVLTSPINLGFSKANNIAIKFASYDYVLLLNTDVVPDKDFLAPLLKHLESETVFAVAPKMYRFTDELDDGIRFAEFRTGLLTPILNVEKSLRNETSFTTFFCGGAVLFKKDIFLDLGGFDIIYSPYSWEDLDLAYRCWKRGYQVIYEPASVVHHYREKTARKVFSDSYMRVMVWRNRFIFMWKNLSMPCLAQHILHLPVKLVKFLCTGRSLYVVGFLWALNLLPAVMYRRAVERKYIKRSDYEIFNLTGA